MVDRQSVKELLEKINESIMFGEPSRNPRLTGARDACLVLLGERPEDLVL